MFFKKRRFKDSGTIIFKNSSTIASNGFYIPDLESDKRFKPYDSLSVVNLNEDNDVEITINNHSTEIIPAGTQRTYNILINVIIVKNIGTGIIAIEDIRLGLRHTGGIF